MRLFLYREPSSYGILTVGTHNFHTIERPWADNRKGVSCVPAGLYRLDPHDSEAHPNTWALVNPRLNVLHWPDANYPTARTACLIHAANLASELRGCIAPGLTRGTLYGQPAVLSSRAAMKKIQELLSSDDEHTLEISNE